MGPCLTVSIYVVEYGCHQYKKLAVRTAIRYMFSDFSLQNKSHILYAGWVWRLEAFFKILVLLE